MQKWAFPLIKPGKDSRLYADKGGVIVLPSEFPSIMHAKIVTKYLKTNSTIINTVKL
ncbi:hypothetical protein KEJ43_06710 [Candidatus Bathyarchaeota archaeon]|nr:hypothetical protein [Candidatus Bathyarchaeota archaeon]